MIRTTLVAAAAAASLLMAGPAALAQAAAPAAPAAPVPSPIVVFDIQAVLSGSAAGQDMNTKLQAIATAMRTELEGEARTLETERQRLLAVPAAQFQSPENVQAQQRFQQRAEELALKDRRMSAELQATQNAALNLFNTAMQPAVTGSMTSRNALMAVESNSVYAHVGGVEITADVISRLNASTRTINVQRVTLPAQGEGGPAGAAPAPAAPAARPAGTPVPAGAPLPRAPSTPAPRN
jgi:Skp family chaperone for outer membrane proteins